MVAPGKKRGAEMLFDRVSVAVPGKKKAGVKKSMVVFLAFLLLLFCAMTAYGESMPGRENLLGATELPGEAPPASCVALGGGKSMPGRENLLGATELPGAAPPASCVALGGGISSAQAAQETKTAAPLPGQAAQETKPQDGSPGIGAADLDLAPIEAYLAAVDQSAAEILGRGGIQELWQKAKAGELSFAPRAVLSGLGRFFCREILNNGRLLAQIALLAIAATLLNNLQTGLSSQGVAALSRGVIYTALLGIALQSFGRLGAEVYQAVDTMSGLLYAMAPLLFTMLGAMGGVTAVTLIHPAFLFLLGVGLNVIKMLVLPGIYCSAVFGVVSYLSPRFNVKQLAKLCRDVSLGVMTLMLTLFTAALGIAGLAGSAMDGLTVKAAKTAAGIFVPVVGKTLADTFDTVLGASLVLKNTIGLFGVAALFFICGAPAVKILVMSLLYRLTGALIEPLGDGDLARALTGLGSSLTALFAVVAATGLLFFFFLSILIAMGNVTMMMR